MRMFPDSIDLEWTTEKLAHDGSWRLLWWSRV